MRSMTKGLRVFLILGLLCFLGAPAARADVAVSISFSTFHDALAPHGHWVTAGGYGECWYPGGVAAGWQPYTNGEWVYTDYGWTWASYDPWGDYPFHYGTWVWVDPYGWVWVPGYVWAPAWVTWCYSDSYVGWAPIPPSLVFGVSGYYGRPIVLAHSAYVFVPAGRMVGVNVSSVRLPVARNAAILPTVRKATRFSVSGGIVRNMALPVKTVERASHTTIRKVSIEQAKTRPMSLKATGAVQGNRVAVVSKGGPAAGAAAKPGKVTSKTTRTETHAQKPLAARSEAGSPKPVTHGGGKTTVHERHVVDHTPPPAHVEKETTMKKSTGEPHATSTSREHVAPSPKPAPHPAPKPSPKPEKKPSKN